MRVPTYSSFLPIHTLFLPNRKVTVSFFDLIPGRLRGLVVMFYGQETHYISSRVPLKYIKTKYTIASIREAAGGIMKHQHYHHSTTDSS